MTLEIGLGYIRGIIKITLIKREQSELDDQGTVDVMWPSV